MIFLSDPVRDLFITLYWTKTCALIKNCQQVHKASEQFDGKLLFVIVSVRLQSICTFTVNLRIRFCLEAISWAFYLMTEKIRIS